MRRVRFGERVWNRTVSRETNQALSHGLSFVRNIIIARLISPEHFGIAATFAITVSMLAVISDRAAEKLLIRAREEDREDLQATAQFWQFMRGVVAAGLIAAMAWPMVWLFKVPQAQWAFYWLALVPLLRGCVHLDIKRLQRHMRFGPQLLTELGTQVAITAAAWPLAYWLRDYSVMLWLLIAQAAALAVLSHLLAQRRYRWRIDRAPAGGLLAFGWPLWVNGLLMVAIVQGDRLVVGSMYSVRELGIYAAALTLTLIPTSLLAGLGTSFMIPLLANPEKDRRRRVRRYALSMQLVAFASVLIAATFILLGPVLAPLLLGPRYGDMSQLVVLLAIMQAIRLFRVAPSVAATTGGDPRSAAMVRWARMTALPLALLVGILRLPIEWIAVAGVVGEAIGFLVSVVLLRLRQAIPMRLSLIPAAGVLAGLMPLCVVAHLAADSLTARVAVLCILIGMDVLFVLSFKEARGEASRALLTFTRRGYLELMSDSWNTSAADAHSYAYARAHACARATPGLLSSVALPKPRPAAARSGGPLGRGGGRLRRNPFDAVGAPVRVVKCIVHGVPRSERTA